MICFMNIEGHRLITDVLSTPLPGKGEKIGWFSISPSDEQLVDPASGSHHGHDYFEARSVTIRTTGDETDVLNVLSAAGLEFMPDRPSDMSDDTPMLRFLGMGSAGNTTSIYFVDESCPQTILVAEE